MDVNPSVCHAGTSGTASDVRRGRDRNETPYSELPVVDRTQEERAVTTPEPREIPVWVDWAIIVGVVLSFAFLGYVVWVVWQS